MPVGHDEGESASISYGGLAYVPQSEYVSVVDHVVTLQSLFDWRGRFAIQTVIVYDRNLSRPVSCVANWMRPVAVPTYDLPLEVTPMAALPDVAPFGDILNAMVQTQEMLMADVALIFDRSTFG